MVTQGLLEFRLTSRVYAFADDDRILSNLNSLTEGRYHRAVFLRHLNRLFIAAALCHHANVLRRSATAAAHDPGTHIYNFFLSFCKMCRVNIINGLSILTSRQSRIRIDHDRNRRNFQNIL